MKLDSIVYDVNSLTNAIASELNKESPTFQAIYPSDTATSLVKTLASYGSMLQYQLVSAMANCYTDSAYSEAGIHQLAETLGNRLHGNISSEVHCTISRLNCFGKTALIPAGSKFTVGNLNFFNPNDIIFQNNIDTIHDIKLIQGVWLESDHITSGVSGEKLYFCENFKCNTNLVEVYVGGERWSVVDSFLPYVITDTTVESEMNVVVLRTDPDGRTYIKFGNNSNGIIPLSGTTVKIKYISNEGEDGNLNNNNLEIKLSTPLFFTGNNNVREQLQVKVYATTTASGGFNTQSLDVLRESSPYMFASGQRAIRRNDYKAMLLNHCGYLTCNVWGEYEESKLYGGYDKIMMNMVYYSGIKAIQQYDLQGIKTLSINNAEFNTTTNAFYNISGNIESARGFLGSYIIDISSYTAQNQEISLKYCDKYGTGVLTCDPETNPELKNFEVEIYPVNDLITDKIGDDYNFKVSTNQDIRESEGIMPATANPKILYSYVDGEVDYISTGKTEENIETSISFSNPFQIRLSFEQTRKRRSIAAFAFQAPSQENLLRNFINQFAIYATNATAASGLTYDNIKNNSQWTRIAEMQEFDFAIDTNKWSNWITTNLYQPGTSVVTEENLSNQCATQEQTLFDIVQGESGTTYSVKVDGEEVPANEYSIYGDTLEFVDPVKKGSEVVLYSEVHDWKGYVNYVIEIYTCQDTTALAQQVALQKIKAIYKESASTIWYENNNAVSLNLPIIKNPAVIDAYINSNDWLTNVNGLSLTNSDPIKTITPDVDHYYHIIDKTPNVSSDITPYKNKTFIWKSGQFLEKAAQLKQLALPENMEYYTYDVILNGVTETNQYKTGDELTYSTIIENSEYTFKIKVLNIGNQQFEINLIIDNGLVRNTPLRGKDSILIESLPLVNVLSNSKGNGGTISISSIPTVEVLSSYTGNFYTNADIQAFDLPVIDKYNHFTTYVEFRQPRIKNVNIEIQLEYENVTDYLTVRNKVIETIHGLFTLTPYYIGSTLDVSNIWKAINSVAGVKRFIVLTPTANINCKPYEVIMLPKENLIIHDILDNSETQ